MPRPTGRGIAQGQSSANTASTTSSRSTTLRFCSSVPPQDSNLRLDVSASAATRFERVAGFPFRFLLPSCFRYAPGCFRFQVRSRRDGAAITTKGLSEALWVAGDPLPVAFRAA
jgi:hypothetical protein